MVQQFKLLQSHLKLYSIGRYFIHNLLTAKDCYQTDIVLHAYISTLQLIDDLSTVYFDKLCVQLQCFWPCEHFFKSFCTCIPHLTSVFKWRQTLPQNVFTSGFF